MTRTEQATDQLLRLERTVGYPNDARAFMRLRDGLLNACNRYQVEPIDVVSCCVQASKFCPTDFDLYEAAKELAVRVVYEPVYSIDKLRDLMREFSAHGFTDLCDELRGLYPEVWSRGV